MDYLARLWSAKQQAESEFIAKRLKHLEAESELILTPDEIQAVQANPKSHRLTQE